MKSRGARYLKGLGRRGAAMPEYLILIAGMVVVLPGLVLLGAKTSDLFEFPGPDEADGPAQVVVIEPCAMDAACPLPPVLIEHCLENLETGDRCGDPGSPWVVVKRPEDPSAPENEGGGDSGGNDGFLVPVPEHEDPVLAWAYRDDNENVSPMVYANRPGGEGINHEELISHVFVHPAADYCEARGLTLPPIDDLMLLGPMREEIGLANNLYHSSSQRSSIGYAPSMWWPINYTVSMWGDNGSLNGWTDTLQRARVRCVSYS